MGRKCSTADKELAQKAAAAKYDPALEAAASSWLQEVISLAFDPDTPLQAELKSGVALCKLVNAI